MAKNKKIIFQKKGLAPHQKLECREIKLTSGFRNILQRKQTKFFGAGFTLIELLITIFLISVGLIGVISFFNSSLQSQFDAKNEVIAAGLAQEGTELVRNIVDYNFQNPPNLWWENVASSNAGGNACANIDYSSLANHNCTSSAGKNSICLDASSGRYYQCITNPSPTGFIRKLDIVKDGTADLDTGDCLKVTSTVGWPDSNSACSGSTIGNCPYKTVSTDIICKPRQ